MPERQRSESVKRTTEHAAEFILRHHVFKRSHNLAEVIKPEWQRFIFPTLGDIDTLEMLLLLTKLGFKDRRMREAVDLVDSRQDGRGRWRLERSYNDRSRARIEQEGQPSKWITLRALTVLRRYRARSRTSY